MNVLLDLMREPWQLEFMRRALVVGVVAGVVCGVLGIFVVLRGMAFVGDAVAHSVFPGVAVGYVLGLDLTATGFAAGLAAALLVAGISQQRRLREDSVIGVVFATAFALGIVLVSTQDNYTGDLSSFLFGQILGIGDADVVLVAVCGALVLGASLALQKELVAVSLDRETARATGLPVGAIDAVLYVLVTVAIVMSLQAVGNVLVLALLVTPAATARLCTDRLGPMMAVAATLGAAGPVVGLSLSYRYDLAAGGLIVLVLSAVFVAVWVAAPRHGLVASWRARRRTAASIAPAGAAGPPAPTRGGTW